MIGSKEEVAESRGIKMNPGKASRASVLEFGSPPTKEEAAKEKKLKNFPWKKDTFTQKMIDDPDLLFKAGHSETHLKNLIESLQVRENSIPKLDDLDKESRKEVLKLMSRAYQIDSVLHSICECVGYGYRKKIDKPKTSPQSDPSYQEGMHEPKRDNTYGIEHIEAPSQKILAPPLFSANIQAPKLQKRNRSQSVLCAKCGARMMKAPDFRLKRR